MRGALLRSGKSGAFTALGETGQPVYRAALQLREAIRCQNPDMATHLAIPQSDELGDNIDWYSELPGDVIPWASATPQERAQAVVELEQLQSFLNQLSAEQLDPDSAHKPSVDRTVFGKLLAHVLPFPDENYVYLVNGKPVLTFWGFRRPGTDHGLDPLYCLRPQVAPVTPAPVIAPLAEPAPAPAPVPVPVVARSWWRWLWWLIPLLLLLLLLFGLRSCGPQLGVPVPAWLVDFNLDGLKVSEPVPGSYPTSTLTPSRELSGSGQVGGAAGTAETAGQVPEVQTPPAVQPESVVPPGTDNAQASMAQEPPTADNATTPPTPPTIPDELPKTPAPVPVPGEPLIIPADSADGQAAFLNGHYRAGAGIQDKNTGLSLRLEYQFKDGKGEVIVRKANGISCTGPVSAAMQAGSLAINSQAQAACSDGSSYDMPQIDCRQGAKSIADCTGAYEDKKFPITMRQTGE
ncbi:SrfA family protein [Pseudomonas paraversuta]|uniref:SrfA family protein n=1 Tax=Pseudomonas paraversuta TaxID=2750624 RepID=UPI00192403C6|nr:SrfA family protein [Pseudomonas paraversuta]